MSAHVHPMRRSGQRAVGRAEKGISLIELMISLVIGLAVVGAVIVSIIGSSVTGRYQAAFGQMNEDAQIALGILKREIELAGYSQPTGLVPDPLVPANQILAFATMGGANNNVYIFGCARGFVNLNTANDRTCVPNLNPGSPMFEVVYEADAGNTQLVGGVPSNCASAAIAGLSPYLTQNRYFVSTTASGRPELRCTSGGNTQPLVENIESMRVWYGMAVNNTSTQVAGYLTPEQVPANTWWQNVISARVCLIVRSAEPVLTGGEDDQANSLLTKYRDCDMVEQTTADRYLRRAYFTTATVRNKMPQ